MPEPCTRSRRPVRARHPRPAHLGHRPLQLPLHLLHAGGGHDSGCRASEVLTFEEIERLAAAVRRALRRRRRSASPAASRPCGPTCPCSSSKLRRRCGVDAGDDHQRRHAAPARPRPARRRARRVNICLDTLRPRPVRRDDPARRAAPACSTASTPRMEAGFDPVKINAVVERGVNDDEIVDLADVRPRARRRGALHRVHAARRRRRTGRNDQVVSQDEIVARIDAVFPLEPVPARGAAPADRWRYLDGARHGRRHPERHQAVLRRLRPRPPHRRRPVPHLPVRHRRVRPARRACAAARPTTSWRRRSSARSARSGPATRSTRSTSSGRRAR